MVKRATISVIAFILTGGAAAQAYAHGHAHADVPRIIIRFGTMYGVDGPFLGDSNKIRGIPGDDLPWEVERVDGFLLTDGRLKIAVRGLVFKDDPSVPPELVGINDADEFRAIVSCLTEDSETRVGRANIFSKGFPATRSGNALIDTKIDLPDTCVAPIVFIAPGDEKDWFAVTGNEIEEDE
jgi:hypothetical protein